jgi:hypothetical protein
LAAQWAGFTAAELGSEEFDAHPAIGVIMRDARHHLEHVRVDTQFLPQLAPQTLGGRFPWFALSPRKLPQATQMIFLASAGQKQFPAAEEQSGGDFQSG